MSINHRIMGFARVDYPHTPTAVEAIY